MSDQYVYSPIDFCGDCYAAGFRVGKGLATILAIAGAESGYDPKATNTAGNTPPSTDRGIIEINSYWHPEVSDACAFDPRCSAVQAFRISTQGTNFTPWATYTNGAYKAYLKIAWMAIDAFTRIQKLGADKDALNAQITSINQQLAQVQSDAKSQEDSLNAQVSTLTQQLSQIQSGDQTTIANLQQQVTDITALRDAAVTRAETAEGKLSQIINNINQWINTLKSQLLGS